MLLLLAEPLLNIARAAATDTEGVTNSLSGTGKRGQGSGEVSVCVCVGGGGGVKTIGEESIGGTDMYMLIVWDGKERRKGWGESQGRESVKIGERVGNVPG